MCLKFFYNNSISCSLLLVVLVQNGETREIVGGENNDLSINLDTVLKQQKAEMEQVNLLETEILKLKQQIQNSTNAIGELSQANQALSRIADNILSNDYNEAKSSIKKHHPTQEQWLDIIEQIYKSNKTIDSLKNLERQMVIDRDKLMFYVALKRFEDENPVIAKSQHKIVLGIEGNITLQLKPLLEKSFQRNEDTGSTEELQFIRWDLLTKDKTGHSGHQPGAVIIQEFFNSTLDKASIHLDTKEFVKRIENITTDSESNKIYKALLYGALVHRVHVKSNDNDPYIFTLAYSIRDYTETFQLRSCATDENYFGNYLRNKLMSSFHGCIRDIVEDTKRKMFSIENVKYKELLMMLSTTRKCKCKSKHIYRVYTNSTRIPDALDRFELIYENGWFLLKDGFHGNRFVDAFHESYVHAIKDAQDVHKLAVKILPSQIDRENCNIENQMNRFLYSCSDLDSNRRGVYSNSTEESRNDSSRLWKFRAYNETV